MKIISWNIHHWWNKKTINKIIESLDEQMFDICILTEFRENNNWKIIKKYFSDKWYNLLTSNPENNDNWILIILKWNIKYKILNDKYLVPSQRWLEFEITDLNLRILAVHIPWWWDKYNKKEFWIELLKYAELNKNNKNLIIWDYNTWFKYDTQWASFKFWNFMEDLVNIWYIDIFNFINKKIEFSWYSYKWNWFRIDHVFWTKNLIDLIKKCYFLHKYRENKISDHSMLVVEI